MTPSIEESREQGFDFYEHERYNEAIKHLEPIVRQSPGDTDAALSLSYAYANVGRPEQAIEVLRLAQNADPENPDILRQLGFALHEYASETGNHSEAIAVYMKCIQANPDDLDVLVNLGALLSDSSDFEESLFYLTRAAELDDKSADIFYVKARSLMQLNRLPEAQEALEHSLAVQPDYEKSVVMIAQVFEAQGDIDHAMKTLNDSLAMNPDSANINFALATTYSRMGQLAEAVEPAAIAARLFEESRNMQYAALALWYEGWARFKQKDYKPARKAYEKALSLYPSYTPLHFQLGLVHLIQGRERDARRAYHDGLQAEMEPSDLKFYGIDALQTVLLDQPDISGADEILGQLEEAYQANTMTSEPESVSHA